VPFTFAHPVAAIPMLRPLGRFGVLSALIIGSMTPDFHYFLAFAISRGQSHSGYGLLWFCVPTGLLGYFGYHLICKKPLQELLPDSVQSRLLQQTYLRGLPKVSIIAVLVSLSAGATTHLIWDAFTHKGEWGVQVLAFLKAPLFAIATFPVAGYQLLQYFSSVLGCAVIVVWCKRWLHSQSSIPNDYLSPLSQAARRTLWFSFLLLPIVVFFYWIVSTHLEAEPANFRFLLKEAFLSGLATQIGLVAIYCCGWQILTARDRWNDRGNAERPS
jgi:hypothetical protein